MQKNQKKRKNHTSFLTLQAKATGPINLGGLAWSKKKVHIYPNRVGEVAVVVGLIALLVGGFIYYSVPLSKVEAATLILGDGTGQIPTPPEPPQLTPLHNEILDTAGKIQVGSNFRRSSILTTIKTKLGGDANYKASLQRIEASWAAIEQASQMTGVPASLIAAVYVNEGQKPDWVQDGAIFTKELVSTLPSSVKNLLRNFGGVGKLCSDPLDTSYGFAGLHILSVLRVLGYNLNTLTYDQVSAVKSLMQDPRYTPFLVAAYIKSSVNHYFPGQHFNNLAPQDQMVVMCSWNNGLIPIENLRNCSSGKGLAKKMGLFNN